jgi:hypothetical protein
MGGFDMKKIFMLLVIALTLLFIAGCTAGPNEFVNSPNEEGKVAGFWLGLWHGFISPITFVVSLFTDTVHIYEIHNSGGWYNFGFLLGVSIFFGGGGGGVARRRCK